jgi:hypothetical protein
VRADLPLYRSYPPSFPNYPTRGAGGHDLLDGLCEEFLTVDYAVRLAGDALGWTPGGAGRPTVSTSRTDLSSVRDLHRLVEAGFGRLAISIMPNVWMADPNLSVSDFPGGMSLERDLHAALAEASSRDGVPVTNGMTAFREYPDARGLFSPHSGTLTPQGHRLYAQSLARMIVESVPGAWTGTR